MAVGQDGAMWVALTGGDRLDRIGPNGQILGNTAVPSGSLPTNVCFSGGPDGELYVTASFQQAVLRIRP
jgi:gluconolactonase